MIQQGDVANHPARKCQARSWPLGPATIWQFSVDRSLRPKDHEMRHGEIRSKADEDGNELRYKNLNKIRKGDERRGHQKYTQDSGSDEFYIILSPENSPRLVAKSNHRVHHVRARYCHQPRDDVGWHKRHS